MMQIKFTVPGEPQGKARPRFTRDGRTYTPKKTVEYENSIRNAYLKECEGISFGTAAVKVIIVMYYKIPKSTSKKKHEMMISGEIRPTVKVDLDNCMKVVCDALNGIAYKDDAQIVSARLSKYYSDCPRIEVTIREVIS